MSIWIVGFLELQCVPFSSSVMFTSKTSTAELQKYKIENWYTKPQCVFESTPVLETGSRSVKVNTNCSCVQRRHNYIIYIMCNALSLSTVLNSICDEAANVYYFESLRNFEIVHTFPLSKVTFIFTFTQGWFFMIFTKLTHEVVNDDWTKMRQNYFLHGVVHTYRRRQLTDRLPSPDIDTVGPLRLSCKRDIYTWVFVSTHASVVSNKHNSHADQKKCDHLLPGNFYSSICADYFYIYM